MKKTILISTLIFTGSIHAADYKTALTGKTLYMKGGNCAGLSLSKNAGLMGDLKELDERAFKALGL